MHGSFIKRSQAYFILSFLVLIGCGTLLLKLPFMLREGCHLLWSDALFMAASSVCVTGLAPVAFSDFSLSGQLVVLLLIQLGGLGIMTLSASILIMLGRQMSMSNTMMISFMNDSALNTAEGLLKTVFRYTFICESIGFILLLPGFCLDGWTVQQAVYYALFHSVSAFCNAGLSPIPDSICSAGTAVKVTLIFLITSGGLGFYVIYDLALKAKQKTQRLRVHTKLALVMSAVLITGGCLLLKFFNYDSVSWIDALFQSISARTAGFNSVNIGMLSKSSIMVLIILMLIGAAPGSTAGGMKTTTFGLAVAAIISILKGNRFTLLFRRKIPTVLVLRAFTIMVLYLLFALAGVTAFVAIMPQETLLHSFFEVSSALGTVGMSMGTTGRLSLEGKLLLTGLMFIGRVGPFTLLLFLLGREKNSKLEYPEEKIILG